MKQSLGLLPFVICSICSLILAENLTFLDQFDLDAGLQRWRSQLQNSIDAINFYRSLSNATCFVPSDDSLEAIFATPDGNLTTTDEHSAIYNLVRFSCIPGQFYSSQITGSSSFVHTFLDNSTATNITGGAYLELVINNGTPSVYSGLHRSAILRAYNTSATPPQDDLHPGIRQLSELTQRHDIILANNTVLHIIDSPLTPPLNLAASTPVLNLTSMTDALQTSASTVASQSSTRDRTILQLSDGAYARYTTLLARSPLSPSELNTISLQNTFNFPPLHSSEFTTSGNTTRVTRSGALVTLRRQTPVLTPNTPSAPGPYTNTSNTPTNDLPDILTINNIRVIQADIQWTSGTLWILDGHIFPLPGDLGSDASNSDTTATKTFGLTATLSPITTAVFAGDETVIAGGGAGDKTIGTPMTISAVAPATVTTASMPSAVFGGIPLIPSGSERPTSVPVDTLGP